MAGKADIERSVPNDLLAALDLYETLKLECFGMELRYAGKKRKVAKSHTFERIGDLINWHQGIRA